MKLGEIAALVNGELQGDTDHEVVSAHTLEKAQPEHLTFWEPRHGPAQFPDTQAGCVLVGLKTQAQGQTLIRVSEPRSAFAQVLRVLYKDSDPSTSVHPTAVVDLSAVLGTDISIGPMARVEAGARIGDRTVIGASAHIARDAFVGSECQIHPSVCIYSNVHIGNRVVINSGAVIGSEGFGLVFEKDHYERFPQIGGVEIGDDVEIGANTCIDRGALDNTRIGSGTKLDNLVHIGHNCQVGKHVVMAAQVGLSGSVVVEDYAVLGGQAGIGDRAHIGTGVQLGGQGGLLPDKRLAPGKAYWGTPARPLREYLSRQALVNRLPRLFEEIKRLRAKVKELESS